MTFPGRPINSLDPFMFIPHKSGFTDSKASILFKSKWGKKWKRKAIPSGHGMLPATSQSSCGSHHTFYTVMGWAANGCRYELMGITGPQSHHKDALLELNLSGLCKLTFYAMWPRQCAPRPLLKGSSLRSEGPPQNNAVALWVIEGQGCGKTEECVQWKKTVSLVLRCRRIVVVQYYISLRLWLLHT